MREFLDSQALPLLLGGYPGTERLEGVVVIMFSF